MTAEEGEETTFEEGLFDGPIDVAEIKGGVGWVVWLLFDFGQGGVGACWRHKSFGGHGWKWAVAWRVEVFPSEEVAANGCLNVAVAVLCGTVWLWQTTTTRPKK